MIYLPLKTRGIMGNYRKNSDYSSSPGNNFEPLISERKIPDSWVWTKNTWQAKFLRPQVFPTAKTPRTIVKEPQHSHSRFVFHRIFKIIRGIVDNLFGEWHFLTCTHFIGHLSTGSTVDDANFRVSRCINARVSLSEGHLYPFAVINLEGVNITTGHICYWSWVLRYKRVFVIVKICCLQKKPLKALINQEYSNRRFV